MFFYGQIAFFEFVTHLNLDWQTTNSLIAIAIAIPFYSHSDLDWDKIFLLWIRLPGEKVSHSYSEW